MVVDPEFYVGGFLFFNDFFVIIPLDLERSFTWPDVHKSGGRSASRDRSSFVLLFVFFWSVPFDEARAVAVRAGTNAFSLFRFYFASFTTDRRLALILHYL